MTTNYRLTTKSLSFAVGCEGKGELIFVLGPSTGSGRDEQEFLAQHTFIKDVVHSLSANIGQNRIHVGYVYVSENHRQQFGLTGFKGFKEVDAALGKLLLWSMTTRPSSVLGDENRLDMYSNNRFAWIMTKDWDNEVCKCKLLVWCLTLRHCICRLQIILLEIKIKSELKLMISTIANLLTLWVAIVGRPLQHNLLKFIATQKDVCPLDKLTATQINASFTIAQSAVPQENDLQIAIMKVLVYKSKSTFDDHHLQTFNFYILYSIEKASWPNSVWFTFVTTNWLNIPPLQP